MKLVAADFVHFFERFIKKNPKTHLKKEQSLWFWTAQLENNQSLLPKRPVTPPRDYVPRECFGFSCCGPKSPYLNVAKSDLSGHSEDWDYWSLKTHEFL